MVRCPRCGTLVSEWAACCADCGLDVSNQPLDGASLPAIAGPRFSALGGSARPRGALLVVAVLLVVGAAAAGVTATAQRSGTGRAATSTLTGSPYASTVGRLVPPGHVQAGDMVGPVTLLDGRRFQLRFPPALGISSLGVSIAGRLELPAGSPTGLAVIASHATVAQIYGSARPRHTYLGLRNNRILLFDGIRGSAAVTYLVSPFGKWLLTVEAAGGAVGSAARPLSDQQRAIVARSIDAFEDPAGYLGVRPRPPPGLATAGAQGGA